MAEQVTRADNEELFSRPDLPFDLRLPPGEPDNYFFEDDDGKPQGRSWDGEIEGLKTTIGQIKAGTTYCFAIDAPEIVCVYAGAVSYLTMEDLDHGYSRSHMFPTFGSGMAFDLPVNEEFELNVPRKEDQASGDAADKPSDLIYTCFYPKTYDEFRQVTRLIGKTSALVPNRKLSYLGTEPASGIHQESDQT